MPDGSVGQHGATARETESDLIVPIYCQDYLDKEWCGVELRAIEALLFEQKHTRVLPFRFDMVEIPGSTKTDFFPVVSERQPEDIARLILDRYRALHPTESEAGAVPGDPEMAASAASRCCPRIPSTPPCARAWPAR